MMSTFLDHVENLIFSIRPVIIGFFVVITLYMGYGLTNLHVDAGFSKHLPLQHEYMQTFMDHRDEFGGANRVLVALRARDGNMFTPEFFQALRQATDEVFFIDGVDRSRVQSLFTPNVRFTEVVEDGIAGGNVVPADFQPTEEGLEQVRKNILKSGVVGRLVANDFSAAIISAELIEVDPQTGEKIDFIEVGHQLEALRDKFENEDIAVHIIGYAKVVSDIADGAERVIFFFIAAFFITGLLVYVFTRSHRVTTMVMICSLIALVWQLGMLTYLGFGIDPMGILVPFLVFAIAVSHGVQMVTANRAAVFAGDDSLSAARSSFRKLLLPGGVYQFDSRFRITAVGTPEEPITIRPRAGAEVTIRMNTRRQNILEVNKSRHLVIRGITFTGGSQGIRLIDSDYITIEDCEIYETGDVAIAANGGGTFEGLIIRRNHIHHTNGTGEGMYLGCNHDKCRVLNSLIEGNYVHHTNRPSVRQGDGIEIKEGSAGNIVRHNVVHDTNYPGILVYSTAGNGGPNIVEGNLVWNSNDNGIQAAADAIIRNNIVLGAPIALQRHQAGRPANLTVVHNTVITPEGGIEVRDVTGRVVVANNAVYAQDGPAIRLISGDLSLVIVAGNVVGGGLAGSDRGYVEGRGIGRDFTRAHYFGAPPIDVFPSVG
ncbi:MAG: right-handed parallel beta-helix repeat-containing protein, partial [Desulfuromonadales bacterium]